MKNLKQSARDFVDRVRNPPPVVAVLRLSGVIGGMGSWSRGLSLASLAGPVEAAFKVSRLEAVALAINSPGGSPAQSALIAKRIRDLAKEKDVPVFAFAEDVAASGGYWLALAGDEIFAQETSIVGSIGVISAGFGFTQLLQRIGVERRLHTAGDRKAILDPFQAEKPADVKHLKSIQQDIHHSFQEMVRERRGGRLKAPEKELFNGAFWTGGRALEMGLIDGIGDLRAVMRDRFGETVKLKLISARRPWLRLPFGPGGGGGHGGIEGAHLIENALSAVEERLMWSRFGL